MKKDRRYVVYRVLAPDEKIPIGELVERRRAERKDNAEDMLRLARKRFSSSAFESLEITVESKSQDEPVTPGGRQEP